MKLKININIQERFAGAEKLSVKFSVTGVCEPRPRLRGLLVAVVPAGRGRGGAGAAAGEVVVVVVVVVWGRGEFV